MRLKGSTLESLATMICGDDTDPRGKHFPYRSSTKLTQFFSACELEHRHDGSTRYYWVLGVLDQLNKDVAPIPDLPPPSISKVVSTLLDPAYFERDDMPIEPALAAVRKAFSRDGLDVFADGSGHHHLRATGTGVTSATATNLHRPLSAEEKKCRALIESFLDSASEDEFTEKVLLPLFQSLGFVRVSPAGHKEKALEFGKDLWMKYQLPTSHWLYFCAQVKRGKIDAARNGGGGNAAEVLTQCRMAFDSELFDPDINKKVLLDHIFIIASGDITRAAKAWIAENLDRDGRRQLIFMDRDELLNHAGRILVNTPLGQEASDPFMPF